MKLKKIFNKCKHEWTQSFLAVICFKCGFLKVFKDDNERDKFLKANKDVQSK